MDARESASEWLWAEDEGHLDEERASPTCEAAEIGRW
jgi:hypothetical protein